MIVNVIGNDVSEEEKQAYVEQICAKYTDRIIEAITITADGDFVDVKTEFAEDVPFDRIRRITGYLVGSLDRFCDGKRAEEHDRVKHTV